MNSAALFWGLASLMTISAVFLLALPWIRGRREENTLNQDALNVALYRERLAELAKDFPEGELVEQERQNLERDLLADVTAKPVVSNAPLDPQAGRWALVAVALTLPVLSMVLYGLLGSGQLQSMTPTTGTASANPPPGMAGGMPAGMPSINEMVVKLAARLKEKPDAKGWAMLGRSYVAMDRLPEALDAYGKAYALAENDGNLAADYAEVIALNQDNQLDAKVRALVAKALAQDKDNLKALWLAGMAEFQDQNYSAAAERWKQLLALAPEGSGLSNMVTDALDEVDRLTK